MYFYCNIFLFFNKECQMNKVFSVGIIDVVGDENDGDSEDEDAYSKRYILALDYELIVAKHGNLDGEMVGVHSLRYDEH